MDISYYIELTFMRLPWVDPLQLKSKIINLEPCRKYWSKALAIGDADWLERVAPEMGAKRYKIYEGEKVSRIKNKIHFLGEALLF